MTTHNFEPVENTPLAPEKTEKVKIFATVSLHKRMDQVPVGELLLSLTSAYSYPDAIYGVTKGVKESGYNPDEFNVSFVTVMRELDEMVIPSPTPLPAPKTPIQKETDQLVAYVRYVFEKSGDPVEKQVAEDVIKKFVALFP